jgi:hypothetical protein
MSTIRYAIQITKPELSIGNDTFFASRIVGIAIREGELSLYVENAKTFANPKGAERWVEEHKAVADWWLAQGWTFKTVPVRMRRGSKTVPVAVAHFVTGGPTAY